MAACPTCSSPIRETARFCDRCGADVSSGEHASTIVTPERRPGRREEGRFVPGTVIDRRYRIVAPLGRGGMGEVYRADDLKLGQTVALKFLPRSLEQDAGRLALLLDEVKAARQVSHPNVCRVWDVGEAEGLHFVAMEYVDGEDLGSLLRRIGRLPEDRGVQVAREICAGLAAIHDQGLLHRDLKPANIMLDGRGHARITDFGLAARAESVTGGDVRSGTPAYMAPETLEGREVTARSDLYALGLVLYELFTGRPAFASVRTPTLRGSESRPEMPSSHVRSIDPVVERAILRCLETDPAQRPSSAIAVAQALPGGDPLAAAISLGETPSPGMVAAAGGAGGLTPRVAAGCVALALTGLIATLMLSEARGLPFGPDDKPYAALRDRGMEFLRTMGIAGKADQIEDGFSRVTGGTPGAPGAARRDLFYFLRRSPRAIYPVIDERAVLGGSRFSVPGLEVPGEGAVRLDLRGNLLEFRRVPAVADTPAVRAPDWSPLFAAAGIEGAPRPLPAPTTATPVPADTRFAWSAITPQGEMRVEGGAHRGVVTFFAAGLPYAGPVVGIQNLFRSTIVGTVLLLLLAISGVVAHRNLRVGRADVNGALRIATVSWLVGVFGWNFLSNTRNAWPGTVLLMSVSIGLFFAALLASCYLALEPIVRRRHPRWLASWTRLLDGRWFDPLVGRHVVIGALAGVVLTTISGSSGLLAHTAPYGDFQAAAVGGWLALGVMLRAVNSGLLGGLMFPLILVLLRLGVRKESLGWLAWVLWAAFLVVTDPQGGSRTLPGLGLLLIQAGVIGLVLRSFGVLPLVIAYSIYAMLNEEYLTVHLGAWYAGVTVAAVMCFGIILLWGTVAALRTPRDSRLT